MRTAAEITADARPGAAFSNHTSYDIWAGSGKGCYDCVHDETGYGPAERWCPILGVARSTATTPVEWPPAVPYGVGECTGFERGHDDGPDDDTPPPDPSPPPACDGQLDIVDAYLDTAITELSKGPELVEATSADPHARCESNAGKPVHCDRCARDFVCAPWDDFYCAAEGDHCCERCLVKGKRIIAVDPSRLS